MKIIQVEAAIFLRRIMMPVIISNLPGMVNGKAQTGR